MVSSTFVNHSFLWKIKKKNIDFRPIYIKWEKMNSYLKCPICNSNLIKNEKSYICSNSHSFDISKLGYVNLLPCSQKNSKDPGDSKEMVGARNKFLQKDFYRAISDSLNEFILKQSWDILDSGEQLNISETGCGSGYYLINLRNFLSKNIGSARIGYCGLDISKHAINIASRADKNIGWAVASSYNIPFMDNSQDIVINIFAPHSTTELIRVLKPNGKIYFIVPGRNHLNTFRESIYGNDEKEKNSDKLILDIEKSNVLKVKNIIRVGHELNLDNNVDIMNLLTMTPYYWNMDSKTLQ